MLGVTCDGLASHPGGSRNTSSHMLQKLEYVMAWWAAWHMHMHADFTSTSELPFASLERVLVLNVSHENDLIFMRMNVQVTYIFIHRLVLPQRQK